MKKQVSFIHSLSKQIQNVNRSESQVKVHTDTQLYVEGRRNQRTQTGTKLKKTDDRSNRVNGLAEVKKHNAAQRTWKQ